MRLQLKAVHAQLNDTVRDYAEKRISKLEKRLHPQTQVEVTLSKEHNPSIAEDHVAEAVVYTKGPTIVARESAASFEAAVDLLVEKLERQIERYRDKRVHEPRREAQRRAATGAVPELPPLEELAPEPGEAAA